MGLTNDQIERYSRQIIVPGVGGRAQERLLASSVAIVAEPDDAIGALAYLAGAGVGRIIMHPIGERAPYGAMVERMRDLNPDVAVDIADAVTDDATPEHCDLWLALIASARAAEAATHIWCSRPGPGAQGAKEHRSAATIVARLDAPARIALMPASPPCPLCAAGALLSPPGERTNGTAAPAPRHPGVEATAKGAIAMVAVTEAFRLLAGIAGQQPEGQLIEFDGYVSRRSALGRRRTSGGGQAPCACEVLS